MHNGTDGLSTEDGIWDLLVRAGYQTLPSSNSIFPVCGSAQGAQRDPIYHIYYRFPRTCCPSSPLTPIVPFPRCQPQLVPGDNMDNVTHKRGGPVTSEGSSLLLPSPAREGGGGVVPSPPWYTHWADITPLHEMYSVSLQWSIINGHIKLELSKHKKMSQFDTRQCSF